MTPQPETLDAQQQALVRRLGAMQMECPDCVLIADKEGWGSGCQCQGTGLIRRFSGLVRKCPGPSGGYGQWCIKNERCVCKGTGLVPAPEAEALAWLVADFIYRGYTITVKMLFDIDGVADNDAVSVELYHPYHKEQRYPKPGIGSDPLLALGAAVEAAVAAEGQEA